MNKHILLCRYHTLYYCSSEISSLVAASLVANSTNIHRRASAEVWNVFAIVAKGFVNCCKILAVCCRGCHSLTRNEGGDTSRALQQTLKALNRQTSVIEQQKHRAINIICIEIIIRCYLDTFVMYFNSLTTKGNRQAFSPLTMKIINAKIIFFWQ